MKRLVALLLLVILVLSMAAGCVNGGSQSASPTPTETATPPPGDHPCGDGICEAPENPVNCPEDCVPVATPTSDEGDGGQPQPPSGDEEPTPTPVNAPVVGTPADWEGNVDFTCEVADVGGQYFWRAYIDFEFTVAPDGSITGSGSGEFFDDSCTIDCGTCEFIKLGPISAEVSGSLEEDSFHLSVIPSAEMVARHVCNGVVDVPLMQLLACASVPTGPTDFTIEARDNAWVEWEGTQEGVGGAIKGVGVSAVYVK